MAAVAALVALLVLPDRPERRPGHSSPAQDDTTLSSTPVDGTTIAGLDVRPGA